MNPTNNPLARLLTFVAPRFVVGTGSLGLDEIIAEMPRNELNPVVVGVAQRHVVPLRRRLTTSGREHVRVVEMATAESLGALLEAVDTTYWAPLTGRDATVAMIRCLSGLESNPAAVLAWSGGSHAAGQVPTLLDGRALALSMIQTETAMFTRAMVVVARTAAFGSERSSFALPVGSASIWQQICWMRLMLRGTVWRDIAVEVPTSALAATDSGESDIAAAWPLLVREGEDLGIVPVEAIPARLVAYILADDPSITPGGRLRALASARRAVPLVKKVIVLEAGYDDLDEPLNVAGVEWRSRTGEHDPALDDHGGLATIELHAGEQLDIRDATQLALLLSELDPGERAVVETPKGFEVRLSVPATTATTPESSATERRIRCLRVSELGGMGDWIDLSLRRRSSGGHGLPSFAICAPDFTGGSGGAMALHRLCDLLNGIGARSWIVPMHAAGVTNPDWREPVATSATRLPDDIVVVYPEIVVGNPLAARRVVRWLLNAPGRLNGGQPMNEGPDDLRVVYERWIDDSLAPLWLPVINPEIFFPKEVPGKGRLFWVGKGTAPASLDRAHGALVTHAWPADKFELARVLRAADTFVSCDWMSSLAGEALMCGTPVCLVGEQSDWTREHLERSHLPTGGYVWPEEGEEGLIRARDEVGEYYDAYLEKCAGVATGLETFIELVQQHFPSR